MRKRTYSDEDVLEWIEEYLDIGSVVKVAKKFNVSQSTVSVRLKEFGIKTNNNIKFSCNEDFFKQDTSESFYWAGFIAADGCVFWTNKNKTSGALKIGLSTLDVDMLRKFINCINYTGKIYDTQPSDNHPSGLSVLCINKSGVVKDLERFNIIPNKTKVYTFPKWMVNHNLVNHFMRGYVDGDGSFFITNQSNRNHLNFSLCGTKEFLTIFRNILIEHCNLKTNKVCKSKGIWDFRYAGNVNAFKIRDFLYTDAPELIKMNRKYNKAFDSSLIIKPRNEYRFRPIVGYKISEPDILYKFKKMNDVVSLGLNPISVCAVCQGRRKTIKGYIWQYAS